jgi:ferrous iron transport protein A
MKLTDDPAFANTNAPSHGADMEMPLDRAQISDQHIVQRLSPPAEAPDWAQRLEEIGFIAGEQVTVMARGMPGGDPLVVRIGLSTFALRQAEAACVMVRRARPSCAT